MFAKPPAAIGYLPVSSRSWGFNEGQEGGKDDRSSCALWAYLWETIVSSISKIDGSLSSAGGAIVRGGGSNL